MNTEIVQTKKRGNYTVPAIILTKPKNNRIWGKGFIFLCDRIFTDVEYEIIINRLIIDREMYGLETLM